MGVSGAGKTTLMDVLAGRKTGGYIDGDIRISGYPKNQETFARISGYCEQNDIHSPHVTVYESLLYSAWLRLPKEVDAKARKLFLMKRGGEEIYVGPLGHSSCHLIEYFEDVEGVRSIKDGYNPATWMLEVTTQAQEDILGVNFAEIYRNSELYRRNKALINELSAPPAGSKDLFFPTKYSQSFLTQCNACLWKQHKSYWRNPSYTATRIFFTTVIAIIFGTIFWKLGTKVGTQQDLFNSLGSMYAAVLFIGIQNGQTVQPIVDVERTVFYREKAAGMYSALPYAFAQVLIEIPHIFLQTIIYGLIVYSCISFDWTLVKFFWYVFFMFMTFMYFTFYGMMAVAMTPNSDIAAIVSTAFYAIWNIFAGFLIPRPRIPVWWRWYSWACPVAWTLYGLVASQFGDYTTTIETGETVQEFLRRYFGFRHDVLGAVAAAITCFAVLFAFVFAFSIKVFNFQRR
uniref:Pleiotropic drug resistance 12 n=1 Tax=Phalaenopsis equestris TaxID=78828 RepID=A0A1S6YG11_PHAEQ|nr:pleiotropic drug resistance 12 [Phalaenopsis equestris]